MLLICLPYWLSTSPGLNEFPEECYIDSVVVLNTSSVCLGIKPLSCRDCTT